MKYRYIFTALALIITIGANAQKAEKPADLAGHKYAKATSFRPGEVLVKFKGASAVTVRSNAKGRFATASVSAVDKVLSAIGAESMEQLMPLSGSKVSKRQMKAYNGKTITDTDLSKLYLVRFEDKSITVDKAVKQLQTLDDVEYAEPNYIVYTMGVADWKKDPYYSQQSYLSNIKIPAFWNATATKADFMQHRPVIAIIDTGVDITHPDLADNIWTNASETADDEIDNDGNGFKDDVHGWDFVNQTGRIGDWNGHGSHCAGLAAAVGGNGKGIAGANPEALIMPVTVMQSDGSGDMATIVKGIDYAFANGADVISMSIGGYAHSVAEEQALAKAYSKCVIVAAAGNDCLPINSSTKCPYCGLYGQPCFPGAFTFVLGVQAGNAIGMFSNFDDDGPVYSAYSEEKLYNYEVSAPGLYMLSTYPGGRYKKLSGTSMATPLVAGAISRLIQKKEILSKEILFGDLINTSNTYVNMLAAYNISDADRHPTLYCVTMDIKDPDGDNDGRVDAGEIVEIWPTIRNDWGEAKNITLSAAMGENEDPSLVEFVDNNVSFGTDLSSYAKAKTLKPLRIKISKNCVDGRKIRLVLKAHCDNISEDMQGEFTLKAENGVELGGTQRTNITLEPGVQYIVTRNWGIPKDVIVTVKAGTTLKIHDDVGISNYGYINFKGNPDSLITITKGDNDLGYIGGFLNDNANYVNFNNVIFENLKNIDFSGHTYEHCIIRDCEINSSIYFSTGGTFRDCDIYNNMMTCSYGCYLSKGATFVGCNVHNNEFTALAGGGFGSTARFYHSNYIGNTITTPYFNCISTPGVKSLDESNCYGNFYDALNDYCSIIYNTTEPEITYLSNAFLGTTNDSVAYKGILDEVDNIGWGHVDVWNVDDNFGMSRTSFEDAPGCVDYIKVDGVNPQDEPDKAMPLGVGKHEVEIGFNRSMNQNVNPWVTMGVRPPYTQKTIDGGSYWFDPYTYKTSITIDGKSATDGTNRIRVMDYQQKGSDFVMPEEHYRYNVIVQAAGSMSTGMEAEPGLGKVTLTWETDSADFADIMGYNIYRFTRDTAAVASDTIMVNSSLISSDSTQYVDYDVVPGTTYYYFLKEIGTDFTQYDISKTVAATPLTAQKGDSNGSLNVDIADVMTDVAYLSDENPTPFIFEAADVNSDNVVNILDVVGTLQLITSPQSGTSSVGDDDVAYYYIEDGMLYIDTPVALGGVQVEMKGGSLDDVAATEELSDMENMKARLSADKSIFLAYSMSKKVLSPGEYPLLSLGDDMTMDKLVLSSPRGANITAMEKGATCISSISATKTAHNGIYDLTGRRLNSMPKHGVVIVNGKKICL